MKHIPSIALLSRTSCCLAALMLAFTACQNTADEFVYIEEEMEEENEVPVVVTNENGNPTSLSEGTTIGVYVIDANGSVTCQQVAVDGDGNAILPAAAQGGSMVAYSPFQAEWGEDAIMANPVFTVSTDQSDDDDYEASDLIIGSTAQTRAADSMTFKHMLAKVAIHIVDETGKMDLSTIGARLLDVDYKVSVDLLHATVSTITDQRANIEMNTDVTTDWRLSAYAIVAPQDIAEGKTFYVITMKGVKQRYPIPQATTLQGGKTYTINLRLTDDGLIPDGNYVTDWDEQDENPLIF